MRLELSLDGLVAWCLGGNLHSMPASVVLTIMIIARSFLPHSSG